MAGIHHFGESLVKVRDSPKGRLGPFSSKWGLTRLAELLGRRRRRRHGRHLNTLNLNSKIQKL